MVERVQLNFVLFQNRFEAVILEPLKLLSTSYMPGTILGSRLTR